MVPVPPLAKGEEGESEEESFVECDFSMEDRADESMILSTVSEATAIEEEGDLDIGFASQTEYYSWTWRDRGSVLLLRKVVRVNVWAREVVVIKIRKLLKIKYMNK